MDDGGKEQTASSRFINNFILINSRIKKLYSISGFISDPGQSYLRVKVSGWYHRREFYFRAELEWWFVGTSYDTRWVLNQLWISFLVDCQYQRSQSTEISVKHLSQMSLKHINQSIPLPLSLFLGFRPRHRSQIRARLLDWFPQPPFNWASPLISFSLIRT